jgi:transcriptional regulator with XRE-family HTH domain
MPAQCWHLQGTYHNKGGKMEPKKVKRVRQKNLTKEVFALRKMRELRGLSRKDVAPLVGVSFKQIEQVENGRVELTKKRISQYCIAYGFSQEQFLNICEGKIATVKSQICDKKVRIIEHNDLRRSYKKIVTKEAQALRALRRIKGLSQDKASYICGYSRCTIGHIENGRIDIPNSRIRHIVESYGFCMKDYEYHLKSDTFVTDIQDDCINIIKKLSEEKLKAVYPLLQTFKK